MRPGDRVAGRFEIVERAASGGMGAVYRAHDVLGGPDVALKLLHTPAEGQGDDAVKRLLREGAALARLEHANIVRHIAHGTTVTGVPYVAMEWIEGETLGKRLARERLTVRDAVAVGRLVAGALGAAHAHGIIHRDVKPSNVMLAGGALDRALVVDFGVARTLREASLTATGAFIGTPAFMAPERARGETSLGPAADVFALGCVLYRALAGHNAFQGEDVVVVLGKILLDEPRDLGEIVPSLPLALVQLVHRMLSKEPQRRPADGAEAERALEIIEASLGDATLSAPLSAPVAGDESPMSTGRSPRSIGRDELKIVSVLLAGPLPPDPKTLADARAIGVRHGAHVEQLLDGTLVVSVSVRATITDQVTRVARMALALRGALPDARIVLATGRGTMRHDAPVGDVIDRAGAMLAAAGREGITIDRVTASLLGSRCELGMRGERLLLLGERDDAEPARTVLGRPSPYVGRDRELTMLESLFEQTADERRACAVLVTAPAGLGKSRFAHELTIKLRARGEPVDVWTGVGDTASDGSPLLVLGRVIRSATGLRHGDAAELAREKIRARVARTVADAERARVAAFLGEIVRVPFPDEGDARLRAARDDVRLMGDQLTLAWLDFVGAETLVQPVVLVLDDMHWGDLPTVQMVDAALRTHRDRPLFVLTLARPEIEERFPRIFADRDVVTVPLRELARRGAEKLARQLLGTDDAVAQRLAEQSAGNPLLLEELVRSATESPDAPVPDGALAIVQTRLEGLPEAARRLLRAASVQGTTFDVAGVTPLLGGDETEEAVVVRLRELAERELVVPQPSSGQRAWSFRHAIVCDAAYAMLVETDRLLAHRLTAEWLASEGAGDPAAVAEHFERAGERAAAVPHLRKAAERSLEANDFAAVLSWADRAIACGASGEERAALRMLQADSHVWRGEDALVEERAAEARSLFAPGTRGWFVATGSLGFALGRFGNMDRSLPLIEEFFATPPAAGAELERGRAAARLCVHLMHGVRRDLAIRLVEVVNEVASAYPEDIGAQARSAAVRANHAAAIDDLLSYLEHSHAALELRERMGDVRNALLQRSNLGDALIRIGAYPEAEEMLREAVRQADRIGLAPSAAVARYNLSRVLARRERLGEALRFADEAVQRFERTGDRRLSAYARKNRADVLVRLGRLDEAARDAQKAIETAGPYRSTLAHAHATLARVHLTRGALAAAADSARNAMEIIAELGSFDEGDREIRLVHAEALHANGDTDAARAAIREAKNGVLVEATALADVALRETFLAKDENARILALAREWDMLAPLA